MNIELLYARIDLLTTGALAVDVELRALATGAERPFDNDVGLAGRTLEFDFDESTLLPNFDKRADLRSAAENLKVGAFSVETGTRSNKDIRLLGS